MKAFRCLILLSSAALIATTAPAFARQRPPESQDSGLILAENQQKPGNALSAQKREELRKRIEAVRIWRLTEALKLDATTSAKLSSLLSSIDQQKKDLVLDQVQSMRTLREALQPAKPDEANLKAILDKLETGRRSIQDLREREVSGLKDVLTIEQQARYLIFQQEFQREIRGMITRARGNLPGRFGPGPQNK
jgi:Spy/CpxP family protein refolding chaperone